MEDGKVLEPTQRRRLAGLLADAFLDDPMQRWLFPNERRRHGRLSRFYELDLAHRLESRCDVVVAGSEGVAFWHPPGDDRTVPLGAAVRLAPAFLSVVGHHPIAALRVLRAVEARRPATPHWYLSHLAVRPGAQGRGIGGRLLAEGLERAAGDDVGVHLETANPANRGFYRRHGLREGGVLEIPGAPPVWIFERERADDGSGSDVGPDGRVRGVSSRRGQPGARAMNQEHMELLRSEGWRDLLEQFILPFALGTLAWADLGDDVLEVGPGPGTTTALLRDRVPRLTAIELDTELAAALRDHLGAGAVTVDQGDATSMPYDDGRFSAVVMFTMCHHVPTAALQDRLFAEARRVLRPGGVLIANDSVPSAELEALHDGDVYCPIDPAGLQARLEAVGFDPVEVRWNDFGWAVHAFVP